MSAILSEKKGGHKYDESGTSDCAFGCGCWMGGSNSGGPVDPFGRCPNNPVNKNRKPPKSNRGKVLTEKRFMELRRQCFNSMHDERGELTDERTFIVKSVIGHRTGQTYNFIYVRGNDGLVWELPLGAEYLAVRGRRLQVTMTRRIKVEAVQSDFKGAIG